MNFISQNLRNLALTIPPHVTLVAVSKTHPPEAVMEAYREGQRVFGENKVQEMCAKFEVLPKDIEWHMIGHLQSNKVKYIVPFVHLIHGVDSFKLLTAINKEAAKQNRPVNCLLQVYIAQEETKFGFDKEEILDLVRIQAFESLPFVRVNGLMGMASNTRNEAQIRNEFKMLKTLFDELKSTGTFGDSFSVLSMGMSGDYGIAIEEGSTMVRVGSSIFGARSYN
jgi:pyridoxal phosphate enzyme (YggS family)